MLITFISIDYCDLHFVFQDDTSALMTIASFTRPQVYFSELLIFASEFEEE